MTKTSSSSLSGLDSLRDLLGDVLNRIEALENSVGKTGSSVRGMLSGTSQHGGPQPAKISSSSAGEVPSLKAYDTYVKECVIPFAQTCDDLSGLGPTIGKELQNAWEGVRTVLVLASRAKAPAESEFATQLAAQLKPTQDAIQAIRSIKYERDFDRHYKAICEMLMCLSWIFQTAPKQLPASFVKETLGSAEFWSNRIRKDFKGKDEKQIEFCDRLKGVILGLERYIHEYHKTGLTFNPRGVSLAEAVILLSDEPTEKNPDDFMKSPKTKRHPTLGGAGGGNIAGIMGELSKRKNSDGSSAATGLKKVEKSQQTWRKEFTAPPPLSSTTKAPTMLPLEGSSTSSSLLLSKKKDNVVDNKKKKLLKGIPIFEYQDRGFKWVVENQTKESGLLTIEINDPKQQVYMYNCDNVSLKVIGKFKSLVLDKCEYCSVVYDTLISSAEVVNCKKIQLQVLGICPVFTIDKTINLLIWLSEESKQVSTFTTSLSSELNVSFPDGDDQKEIPIPEQFVHRLNTKGSLTSDVSDLYH